MVPVATMGTKTHETELIEFGSVFYFAVAACHGWSQLVNA